MFKRYCYNFYYFNHKNLSVYKTHHICCCSKNVFNVLLKFIYKSLKLVTSFKFLNTS